MEINKLIRMVRTCSDDVAVGMLLSNRIDHGSSDGALISSKQFPQLTSDLVRWKDEQVSKMILVMEEARAHGFNQLNETKYSPGVVKFLDFLVSHGVANSKNMGFENGEPKDELIAQHIKSVQAIESLDLFSEEMDKMMSDLEVKVLHSLNPDSFSVDVEADLPSP